MTALLRTASELAALREEGAAGGRRVVLVPTMGALHDGHAALVRAARAASPDDVLLVSVFVNPLQFGDADDLRRYPRTLDADLALAAQEGADAVWAPEVRDVYGPPERRAHAVRVAAGPLGDVLEGASRPGHFDGVLTVVATLLGLTGAAQAWFGEKDAQQLALVRRMVADLHLGVDVRAVPTVRDPDGMALSSRNARLSSADRERALGLSRGLAAGVRAAGSGREAVLAAVADELAAAGLTADYVALVDDALDPDVRAGPARLLVAAVVGGTRLLDTTPITLPEGP